MDHNEPPRLIGLFLPPMLGYFGDVVMGVQEYAQKNAYWAVEVCPTFPAAQQTCTRWVPDGILVNCVESDWGSFLANLNVPVVQVGGMLVPGLARVSSDSAEIGAIAAEHFMERGLRRFAFCGYARNNWSDERKEGFVARLKAAGHSCEIFPAKAGQMYVKAIIEDLARWIQSLPKPIAIFACHDRVAMLVAKTCEYLHVPVPEEVAILGVDDDPLEGGFASPPLSSVIGSARRVGYEAAALLDKLMRGQPVASNVISVPPAGVAVRRSTDVLTVEDADVAAALRYIREHATDPVEVSQVVKDLQISRRNLERKFRTLLNRTPYEEIRRVRLAHAKTLLLSTHRSILDVALDSGFPSASTFSAVFHRETGLSPRIFRTLYRSRAGRQNGK